MLGRFLVPWFGLRLLLLFFVISIPWMATYIYSELFRGGMLLSLLGHQKWPLFFSYGYCLLYPFCIILLSLGFLWRSLFLRMWFIPSVCVGLSLSLLLRGWSVGLSGMGFPDECFFLLSLSCLSFCWKSWRDSVLFLDCFLSCEWDGVLSGLFRFGFQCLLGLVLLSLSFFRSVSARGPWSGS